LLKVWKMVLKRLRRFLINLWRGGGINRLISGSWGISGAVDA